MKIKPERLPSFTPAYVLLYVWQSGRSGGVQVRIWRRQITVQWGPYSDD